MILQSFFFSLLFCLLLPSDQTQLSFPLFVKGFCDFVILSILYHYNVNIIRIISTLLSKPMTSIINLFKQQGEKKQCLFVALDFVLGTWQLLISCTIQMTKLKSVLLIQTLNLKINDFFHNKLYSV